MQDPFNDPASGFERIQDYAEFPMIVTPRNYVTGLTTKHSKTPGDTDAVDVDVVVLHADGTFKEIPMLRVFPNGLVSQFRRSIGQMVIGRLNKVPTPKGEAWNMATATAEDKALGIRYLEAKNAAKLKTPAPTQTPAMATAGAPAHGVDPLA
jgi:hypothetical protein